MGYYKYSEIIRNSLPGDKEPILADAQIEKLRIAGEIALALIAVGGVITLSAVAPNIFIALDKLFFRKYPYKRFTRKERENRVGRVFYYLKEHKMIKLRKTGRDFRIMLTSFGTKRVEKIDFDHLIITKPRKWDGMWWQVAADIPTKKYKRGADLLRDKLREMGFFSLQRTLWFYPYDPRSEIEWIVDNFGIERFVTVMEINRLDTDDESRMKSYFLKNKVF